jgi:TonB family protein
VTLNTADDKHKERVKSGPPATYPLEASKNGIEGTVILDLQIDAQGKLNGASVANSLFTSSAADVNSHQFFYATRKLSDRC